MSNDGSTLWATEDAAKCLRVSRQHVRRLVRTGQLSLYDTLPGGQMLFTAAAVIQLKRRRGAIVDAATRPPMRITPAMAERAEARAAAAARLEAAVETLAAVSGGKKPMAKAKGERLSIDTSPQIQARKHGGGGRVA